MYINVNYNLYTMYIYLTVCKQMINYEYNYSF